MSLQELSRQTLADQAAESIIDYIRTHSLKPGAMLPAAGALATQLGVSRPVIREALKSLVGQNTIEIINGKGAIIKPIGSKDLSIFFRRALGFDSEAIHELLEVRQGLEVQAARLAAQRRSPEDLDILEQILERMRHHFYDVEAYTADDLTFHISIARSTHNAMMVHMVESIRDATWDSIHRWHCQQRTLEEYTQVQLMHEVILEAIKAGSAEAAAQAMSRHFDEAFFDLEHTD